MTDNTQELDEILDSVWNEACDMMEDGGTADVSRTEAKQAILDWHNKQVEAVLDRLDAQWFTAYPDRYVSMVEEVVRRKAIEAERNKLKEKL